MKHARFDAGAGWIKNVVGKRILDPLSAACNSARDRLCRLICGKRLFNSDLSRELDRLLIENDRLRDELRQRK